MRADRLVALLLFLQSRDRVTAAEAATELEVSLATARRDFEALSAAGIPVYSQPGRHGGWQLLGGGRTNLSGLTTPESRAFFWLLGTSGLSSAATHSATMKLIQALPQTMRHEARQLASSIHYDRVAWGEVSEVVMDAELNLLGDAVTMHRVVEANYTSRSGHQGLKTLRPLGLVSKAGVWYVIADGDDGRRAHRLSRLSDVALTDTVFPAPPDFDLVAAWKSLADVIEELRSVFTATLRVPRWAVPILQQQFGRYCTVQASHDDHSAYLEVRAHLLAGLAEQLAGWGSRIEVLEPADLRAELARIGSELTALYQCQ